uniref:Uncharacterized protein n=1 Tax=Photinus pyralis TaxID=7054 RepID=A0A1Y1LSW6_PHOPY
MNIISTNPNVMHWILYAKPWNCSKLWEKLKGAGSIARGHCDKWNQHSKPSAPKMDWITEEDRGEFLKMFPSLVKELKSDKMLYGHSDVAERFGKFLEHTVPHGKLLNSLTFVAFYKLIEDPARLTPQNVHLSMILGWCVQLLVTVFTVSDDMIDFSETRRGRRCWHLLEDVGMSAINDVMFVKSGIFSILRNHLRDHHCYLPTMELFQRYIGQLAMGQTNDTISMVKVDLLDQNTFNIDNYKATIKFKAGLLFSFPLHLAMHLSSKRDYKLLKQVDEIFIKIGSYFQSQVRNNT